LVFAVDSNEFYPHTDLPFASPLLRFLEPTKSCGVLSLAMLALVDR
jgi:hypothetical protein